MLAEEALRHHVNLATGKIGLQPVPPHDFAARLDFRQHAIELLLAAHQRIDVLHRRHIGVLRRDRPRHRDDGFAGRIGNHVKVKIAAGGGHHTINPVFTRLREAVYCCESMWAETARLIAANPPLYNPPDCSQP